MSIVISPADAVIIVGVVMGAFGMIAPEKALAWQELHAPTLVTAGVITAFIGLALEVILG
ncbi:hypothetical protein LCGC14_2619600 [marine sediment metagenome]|uniref:Uncharacterized protein n=1 Tax=marine sediment metagenome TaxID=412755 RepID=A0A0F9CEF6_9ZZZZ